MMECKYCDGDLELDGDVDTAVIEADHCIQNFTCLACDTHFEIEYSAIDIREVQI